MARDILIVDDDKNALANYGNRIQLTLGIEPFLAYDPRQALNILRIYPIKVLVTDEDMAPIRGTELVRQVREELGSNIPCIMFTGFAHKVDMTKAIKIEGLKFLDKGNVRRLPSEVKDSLERYRDELSRSPGIPVNKIIQRKRRLVTFNSEVTIWINRIVSMEDYSRDSEWETVYRAERGKGVTLESTFRKAVKSSWESEVEREQKTGLDAKLSVPGAELASVLEDRVTETVRHGLDREFELTTKETVTVEQIKDPPPREGLRTREYQYAPVHLRVNVELRVECSCCQNVTMTNTFYDVPTSRIALRVREHFDTSPPEEYYTGFLTGTLSPR
jgi:DNA-binding response OmpR family regulator